MLLIDSHVRVRADLNNFFCKGNNFSGRIVVFIFAADLLYYCQLSLLTPPFISQDFLLISLTVEIGNQRWGLPLLVICQLQAARCCIVLAENRACWEAAVHFWATFPGRWGQSFSLHFCCILGGQPRVGSLFWRAWLAHLHSLELESSITPPGADTDC